MKPIIGLTMHTADKTNQINDVYIQSIIQAGGIPICLPIIAGEDVIPVINKIDGLCLIGGYDIDPRFFEQEPHPNIGTTVKNRDESELAYFYEAFDRDLPILGICRGHQLINVALGERSFKISQVKSRMQYVIHSNHHERKRRIR